MFRFLYGKQSDCLEENPAIAVNLQNLTIRYPGSDEPSLANISVAIPMSTRIALVGHNGAGKSTLLKALVGLVKIESGTVTVLSSPVGKCAHRVAYLPQRGELDWEFPMSVERLVVTGRYSLKGWFRNPDADDYHSAHEALDTLGLADLKHRQIGELSGGQQQRVLFARALTQDPDLLLLDEPFNAVDAETRDIMSHVIDSLQAEGRTVIASTHHLHDLHTRFDGAIYLVNGREIPPSEGAFVGIMADRDITHD